MIRFGNLTDSAVSPQVLDSQDGVLLKQCERLDCGRFGTRNHAAMDVISELIERAELEYIGRGRCWTEKRCRESESESD